MREASNITKKLFASAGVAGTLLVYSIGIRHQVPVIKRPPGLAEIPTSSASSTSSSSSPSSSSTTGPATSPSSSLKDGTYTGSVADAYYGNVQVSATISGGKIVSVKFLQFPNTHSTSVIINDQAMPYLTQEAIQAQSANVQIISGATFTSQAFQQSLASALSQA